LVSATEARREVSEHHSISNLKCAGCAAAVCMFVQPASLGAHTTNLKKQFVAAVQI